MLRAVRITPDWNSLRRERELHLAVDEHSCAGKQLVITVCEARTKQVLTILHNDLCASLQAFPGGVARDIKQRVTCAATDVKKGYRRVWEQWKPGILLSADPFHVVRLATKVMEEERRFQQAEQRLHTRDAQVPAGPLRAGGERLRPAIRARRRRGRVSLMEEVHCRMTTRRHWRPAFSSLRWYSTPPHAILVADAFRHPCHNFFVEPSQPADW